METVTQKEEKSQEVKINHEDTNEIVCPYCGYKMSDSWEMSDDEDSWECSDCQETFSYKRNISISYTSRKKQCLEDGHNFKTKGHFKSDEKLVWNSKKGTHEFMPRGYTAYTEILICVICDKEKYLDIDKQRFEELQNDGK